jgi:hypothetical protein
LGVGWFKYVFSPALKAGATVAGAGLNDESGLKAYYEAQIADHIRFPRRSRKNRFLTFKPKNGSHGLFGDARCVGL